MVITMPKKMNIPKVIKSVSLPVDLVTIIQQIADQEDKSFSKVIVELVEYALRKKGYFGGGSE